MTEKRPEPGHRSTTIRLDEVDLVPLCHEDLDTIAADELDELLDSVLRHGVPDAVEFYRDDDGRCILVRGHRWVYACHILAGQGATGFGPNMKLRAFEIRDAAPDDLLLRSADDPVVRYHLNYLQRLAVAEKLHAAGIPARRAAAALAIPVQTYEALLARAEQLDLA